VEGSCEHGFIKGWQYFDQLSDSDLFREVG